MYSEHTMTAREKLFTMRMSADEMARLERLAEHYGLTVAGTIRLLAKEKYDTIERPVFDPLNDMLADEREPYENVLDAILWAKTPLGAPTEEKSVAVGKYRARLATLEDLSRALDQWGWRGAIWKRLPRYLNELRRAGYIEKRDGGYNFTTRGEAFFVGNEEEK